MSDIKKIRRIDMASPILKIIELLALKELHTIL